MSECSKRVPATSADTLLPFIGLSAERRWARLRLCLRLHLVARRDGDFDTAVGAPPRFRRIRLNRLGLAAASDLHAGRGNALHREVIADRQRSTFGERLV